MQSIRSCIFYIFMVVWTPFVFISLSPLLLTFNERAVSLIGYFWANGALVALKVICDLDYEVIGQESLPNAPFIVASRHESMWETIFFTARFRNVKYVLKKELAKIPFYGWYILLSGMIHINRKLGASAMRKMMKDSKASLERGNVLVIFPEGTRVKRGVPTLIQPGIAGIHKYSPDVPIIPVALNSGLYWPKGISKIKSGRILVKFMPAINSSIQKIELLQEIKEKIDYSNHL